MNVIISAILLGISLCADCFAVALCSSVTVTREEVRRKVWTIAAVFAVIQTGLFLVGWGLGMGATELISEHVAHFEKFAHALGFLLLLYVGGAMFLDGVRSKSACSPAVSSAGSSGTPPGSSEASSSSAWA